HYAHCAVLRSTRFPYTTLFRSLERVAHPVLERPAVLVLAPIAHGREEAREQVAVREVQLEEIEAREDRELRRAHVVGRHAIHVRSEEHTSELQSRENLVCRLLR